MFDPVTERRIKEFTEAAALHRFEASLLFGQLTVYLAVFGALLNAVIKNPPLDGRERVAISLIGLAISLSFTVINERSVKHLRAAIRRAEYLGKELEMPLYAYRPVGGRIFTGLNAVRSLYAIGIITWIYIIAISA